MTSPNTRHQGVPAISQTALNAVADPNVRKVLQDMATGQNVRNGTAGDGNQQFITRAELRVAGIDIASATEAVKKTGSSKPQVLKPSDVPGLINQVQNDIRNSLLWKELGERIELINIDLSKNGVNFFKEQQERVSADNAIIIRTEQQYAIINGNYALLQQKYTTMANDVSAYAQSLTDLQVKVGQNAALIQQETAARATADGQMMAKYTVKVDLNGHVSGFGLMSEANNGSTVSSFIIRADRFAIGSPSTGNAVPFVVYTTPRNIEGRVVPPGVYMDSAVIADGTITKAKIGLAQVDTLEIAGNAVTVPVGVQGNGYVPSAYISMSIPGKIAVFAMCNWLAPSGGEATGFLSASCNGVKGPTVGVSMAGGASSSALAFGIFDVPAGNHLVSFIESREGNRNVGATAIFAIGVKR